MRIIFRPAKTNDLPHCFDCIRDGFLYDRATKQRIIGLWHDLMERQIAIVSCVEDLSETFGRRIVFFDFSVFVQPDFAGEIRAGKWPYFTAHIARMWERGEHRLLSSAEVAAANSGPGLHLLTLNSGAPSEIFTNPDAIPIIDRMESFFYYCIAGYRLNEVLIEGYGEYERHFAAGLRLVERAPYIQRPLPAGVVPNADKPPFLCGLNVEEAVSMRGTLIASLFTFSPPRMKLSPVEQELLIYALGGNTDEELSQILDVSFAAIRKRWDSIYDKVQANVPELFDDHGANKARSGRGTEKRRRVLNYVQFHRTELRPYIW